MEFSLTPTFTLQLGSPILTGLVTVGKFDGKHPSVACATAADHVVVHSPSRPDEEAKLEEEGEPASRKILHELSVNENISALHCGVLTNNGRSKSILLVGTHTNLMAYDVQDNSDLFYKEVPDGVHALAVGTISTIERPLVFVGGNCSLQGFDAKGSEEFWTVTGDNVSALATRVLNGVPQLLVGTEDNEIRVYEDEAIIAETTVSDVPTALASLGGDSLVFGLENGSVGVIKGGTQVWSSRCKHAITSLAVFDIVGDGVEEVVSGQIGGLLEARSLQDGKLLFTDQVEGAVAGLLIADYRMDGRDELICCGATGELRGYLPREGGSQQGKGVAVAVQEGVLRELNEEKQSLLQQLQGFEKNIRQIKSGHLGAGAVPPDTAIRVNLQPRIQSVHGTDDWCVLLQLATNNYTLFKTVIVYSLQEGLFDGESMVVHPPEPCATVDVPLRSLRNVASELLIKAVVGFRSSEQDHVFELKCNLPRFAFYVPSSPSAADTESRVVFSTGVRVNRIIAWLKHSFLVQQSHISRWMVGTEGILAAFVPVRPTESHSLCVKFHSSGQIEVLTRSLELAGHVVQDLVAFLGLQALDCVTTFPKDVERFKDVLSRVEEHNAIRLRLSADMADFSNLVKTLVIKAEDARLLSFVGGTGRMRQMYNQLMEFNRDLVGEYNKRRNNHTELLAALKEVNQTIQRAARFRVGRAKTELVAACRRAIKANNTQALLKILRLGNETA